MVQVSGKPGDSYLSVKVRFMNSGIEAIKNKNSKKVFVLVDDTQVNKVTVINPDGKVLTVPEGLFDPPVFIASTDFSAAFTPAQVATIAKVVKKGRSRTNAKSSTPRRSKAKPKTPAKLGLGAEWTASKLTFYKHKIEPLQDTQSFKIHLENIGTFEITKADFCRIFNEVVISSSYWKEGSYTYGEFPEKARRFIKAA